MNNLQEDQDLMKHFIRDKVSYFLKNHHLLGDDDEVAVTIRLINPHDGNLSKIDIVYNFHSINSTPAKITF